MQFYLDNILLIIFVIKYVYVTIKYHLNHFLRRNNRKLNLQIICGIIDSWLMWWQYLPMSLHNERRKKFSSDFSLLRRKNLVSRCQPMIPVSSNHISYFILSLNIYLPISKLPIYWKMYYAGQGKRDERTHYITSNYYDIFQGNCKGSQNVKAVNQKVWICGQRRVIYQNKF